MSQPKPPGMTWESFADALVSRAMRAGEFDANPGKGKPIRGLDQPYRDDWWLRDLLKREELAMPCAALDLRADVERTLERSMNLPTESAVRREVAALNARIAKTNRSTISGPATSVALHDVEQIVARWRASRSR